jgi:hypothetical protein
MATSKFQSETKRRLKLLLGGYKMTENYRPEWLINPITGRRLEIDLYVEVINVGIEVQGEQHYRFIPGFHKDQADFEYQKQRDEIKRAICKEKGVTLYEVYKLEDVDNFIESVSKSCQEMAWELFKKNCAIKSVSRLMAQFLEAEKKKKHPDEKHKNKLANRILWICKKYNLDPKEIQPDGTLTEFDVSYYNKPRIMITHRDDKDHFISRRNAALIRVTDGIAQVFYANPRTGATDTLHFDVSSGKQINNEFTTTYWELQLYDRPRLPLERTAEEQATITGSNWNEQNTNDGIKELIQ